MEDLVGGILWVEHDIGEGEVGGRVMGVGWLVGWRQRDRPDLARGGGRGLAETRTGFEDRVAANAGPVQVRV